MDRVRIVDKQLFGWKDVDKILKGVLLQHMRAFFAAISTVNQRSPYLSLLRFAQNSAEDASLRQGLRPSELVDAWEL